MNFRLNEPIHILAYKDIYPFFSPVKGKLIPIFPSKGKEIQKRVHSNSIHTLIIFSLILLAKTSLSAFRRNIEPDWTTT